MLGVRQGWVRLRKHEKGWARSYDLVRRRIAALIGFLVTDIQHAGSTAIPLIPAKPILDVVVRLRSRRSAARAARILSSAGYIDLHRHDSVKGRWLLARGPIVRTQHVILTWPRSPIWGNYVRFRDYLLAHPATARRYAELKKRLARRYRLDRKSYTRGKENFIRTILARATRNNLLAP